MKVNNKKKQIHNCALHLSHSGHAGRWTECQLKISLAFKHRAKTIKKLMVRLPCWIVKCYKCDLCDVDDGCVPLTDCSHYVREWSIHPASVHSSNCGNYKAVCTKRRAIYCVYISTILPRCRFANLDTPSTCCMLDKLLSSSTCNARIHSSRLTDHFAANHRQKYDEDIRCVSKRVFLCARWLRRSRKRKSARSGTIEVTIIRIRMLTS